MTAINKYNNSKIYTIRSPLTEQYYIGSTAQLLCKRFSDHKQNYKAYLNGTYQFVTSFKILELGDAYIELLEEINCDNKNQLQKREGELIRKHKLELVNKFIPCQTPREYYDANKDKISEYKKQYNIQNKDKNAEYHKQLYLDNKIQIDEQHRYYYSISKDKKKEYTEANKDKISERKKKLLTCDCGSIIQQGDKAKHFRTIKHIDYINSIIPLPINNNITV